MTIFFNLLIFLIPLFSVAVIITKNPIYAVLYLIIVFLGVAVFLVLIGIHYIALVYMILYIGAIAIFFLFVIMILNLRLDALTQKGADYTKTLPLAAFILLLFFFAFYSILSDSVSDHIILFSTHLLNIKNHFIVILDKILFLSPEVFNNKTVFTYFNNLSTETNLFTFTQIQIVGLILYNKASLLLIIIGFILLLVIVGVIVLCKSSPNTFKENYYLSIKNESLHT